MRAWSWTAALRSADLLRVEVFLDAIRAAGASGVHVEAGDGRFAGFGLGTDLAVAIARGSSLPVDLHVQAAAADRLVKQFPGLGCRSITLHVECLTHAHRAMASIREAGIEAGLAVSPETPLTALEYLLPSVRRVLLVAAEDGGSVGTAAFERVRIVRENIDYHKRKVALEVEGAKDAREIAQLIAHGADRVVIDAPELFRSGDLDAGLRDFIEEIRAQQYVA